METRGIVAAVAASVMLFALVGCSGTGSPATPADKPADKPAASAAAPDPEPAGSDPVFVSSAPDGSPTIAIGESAMDPAELQIAAGTVVAFTSGDDKLHGLVVGGLASVTVGKGLPEYYQFVDPGTYRASDELTDAKATITVK